MIITKKKHCEKTKKTFDIFSFKGILVILLFFKLLFLFGQIPNCFQACYNNKKTIVKI
jgi:hypothetical protein